MSLSAEEVTYCIFNDQRCTSGKISPREIAQTILDNRKQSLKYYNINDPKIYDSKGKRRSKRDVTRYTGDILDYMEIASLVNKTNGYFRLNPNELEAINAFSTDKTFFSGYDKFYFKRDVKTEEINIIEPDWFAYVNNSLTPNMFKTDLSAIFKDKELEVIVDERIQEIISSDHTTNKDIANIGKSIIFGHERMRLKIAGYEKLIALVQIVDSPSYHPGFDIDSFEGDGTNMHRYIEVKTTISKNRIQIYNFHMSPNEWSVAETNRYHYCIYRLMLSSEDKILYILRDPATFYKHDRIEAIPRNGMDVTFNPENFETTPLLIWKD